MASVMASYELMEAMLRMRIGARVFLERRRRKMTALALAEQTGLHRNTIYRIESGISMCTLSQMLRIAVVLGVSLDVFLTDAPIDVHSGCAHGKSV